MALEANKASGTPQGFVDPVERPGYAPAVLLFLAGMAVFAWPWLSGAVTIPWDAKAHFYPQLVFLARSLHEGQAPFWAPQVFGGHPQIADPQSLIFSPPHLLLAALNPAPSFVAFDAVVFAMLAAGGLGVMMLFRDRGWRPEGALVAALAFALGGSNAWRVQHVGQVLSLAWFALALWLLLRAIDRRSIVAGALAGLTAGLMVTGRDQIAWFGVLILGFVAVWRIVETGLSRWRGLVAPLAAGFVVGVAVIALPVALTLAFAAYSNRAAITFEGAAGGSLHPAALYTFVSANLFGVDGPLRDYWGPPSTLVWGENNLALARNMATVYMGATPLVALLTYGLFRGGLFAREVRVFAIAALALGLFALGRYTPVFAAAFHLPGADLFRRPADATFPLCALLAIVAGYCVHRIVLAGRVGFARAALEALPVVLAFAACVFVAVDKGRVAQATPVLVGSGLWLLAALVALWLLPRASGRPSLGLLALGVLLSLDLRVNNGPNESTALPPAAYEALRIDSRDPTLRALKARLAAPAAPDRRDRVEMAAIDFHWPNVGLVHDFDHWLGYNPLRLKWFADATGAIDHVAIPDQRRFGPLFKRYASPMADLLGVRWIATGPPPGDLDKALAPGDLRDLGRVGAAHLSENPRALPRVLFATQAQGADFDAMIRDGAWPAFDPRATVLLETAPPSPPRAPGAASLAAYGNDEVLIDATSPDGGYVVLNDVWHPWWSVEVDGAPAELLRANVIFRAVAVPPGAHRVRFVFRPFRGLLAQMTGR